jgi:DNA-binding response OmpR family regulator
VDWIIAKPFETDQIASIMREVLRRREATYRDAETVAA